MNISRYPSATDVRNRRDFNDTLFHRQPRSDVLLGLRAGQRRQTCSRENVERQEASLLADSYPERRIARALCCQPGAVRFDGFDIYAAPASLTKGKSYRMEFGVIGSNIDIEAILNVTKRPMEHDILKVLRMGDKWHRFPPGSKPGTGSISVPSAVSAWKCRYRDTLRGARLRYCLPVSDCAGPRSRGVVAGSFDINDAVEPVNPVREPIRQAVLRYPIVEFGRGAQATRGLKPSQCPA